MSKKNSHVFLSYSHKDSAIVEKLACILSNMNIRVWYDSWEMVPGGTIVDQIENGISSSLIFAVCIGPKPVANWVEKELELAHVHKKEKDIIAFILPGATDSVIESDLSQLDIIDLRIGLENNKEIERLFQRIQKIQDFPNAFIMPHLPNPNYIRQAELLEELHSALSEGETVSEAQVVLVTGGGGTGKTQLAVEYVYKYGNRYPGGVFWIDAEIPDYIPEQVAACAGPQGLNIPDFNNIPLDVRIKKVRDAWESQISPLIVFDNVMDQNVISDWCPCNNGCRILITSRKEEWPLEFQIRTIRVSSLPRSEAIKLLLQGRPDVRENDVAMKAANEICQILDDLPLALDIARRYLTNYRNAISIDEYLNELKKEQMEPILMSIALSEDIDDISPTPSKQNVDATFQISYRMLLQESDIDSLAMRLFHSASWFAPVSINPNLLMMSVGVNFENVNELSMAKDSILRLIELGLLNEDEDGRIIQHPLLRTFAQAKPGPMQTAEKALQHVCSALAYFALGVNNTGIITELTPELPHLRHLAHSSREKKLKIASNLYDEIGNCLSNQGDFWEALNHYEQALEIDREVYGDKHPNIASKLNNLGSVWSALGDAKKAVQYYEQALEIDREVFGGKHPNVATRLNNLGSAWRALGDAKKAVQYYEQALEIDRELFGRRHPNIATRLNNLGSAWSALGDAKKAIQYYEQALEIDREVFGEKHPNIATTLNNIGSAWQALGDTKKAIRCYEQALEIDREVFGEKHPNIATRLSNMGSAWQTLGDAKKAVQYYEHALTIIREVYGEKHPNFAITLSNMGSAWKALGDAKKAVRYFEQALEIDREVFGEKHPDTARNLNNLGSAWRALGDKEKAKHDLEEAYRIFLSIYGPEHPSTRTVKENLDSI